MNWYLYILGMILCAISGAIDRNPTQLRHIVVTTIYAAGLTIVLYSTGALKL